MLNIKELFIKFEYSLLIYKEGDNILIQFNIIQFIPKLIYSFIQVFNI